MDILVQKCLLKRVKEEKLEIIEIEKNKTANSNPLSQIRSKRRAHFSIKQTAEQRKIQTFLSFLLYSFFLLRHYNDKHFEKSDTYDWKDWLFCRFISSKYKRVLLYALLTTLFVLMYVFVIIRKKMLNVLSVRVTSILLPILSF